MVLMILYWFQVFIYLVPCTISQILKCIATFLLHNFFIFLNNKAVKFYDEECRSQNSNTQERFPQYWWQGVNYPIIIKSVCVCVSDSESICSNPPSITCNRRKTSWWISEVCADRVILKHLYIETTVQKDFFQKSIFAREITFQKWLKKWEIGIFSWTSQQFKKL